MKYLTYTTQAQAESASEKIYANMLRDKIKGKKARNVKNNTEMKVSQANDSTLVQNGPKDRLYPIFGTRMGVEVETEGYTTSYAEPKKTTTGLWAIPKPEDEYVTDGNGDVVIQTSPLLTGVTVSEVPYTNTLFEQLT